ncbi:MAG: hypothetical protein ABI640_12215 [Gammaproteobacteria bacterium]
MSTRTNRCWRWGGALLGALVTVTASAQPASNLPGATYASLAKLPDWSGWWGFGQAGQDELRTHPLPLQPAARDAARAAGPDADPLRYCRPLQFTGSSGGFTEAVEFLFTPGRVTVTNERGLVRRIYSDGRGMSAEPDPTNTGVSIGRWEGEMLIVETRGINPLASYGGVPIGKNVRITERIFLKDPGTLQIDVVTEAPDVLTQPDRRTRLYQRVGKTMANEITWCTEYDRSIEPGSGKQRFDLTPPADLPPPPR